MVDFSIVLPAYNEKDNIVTAITSANNYLKRRYKSYEIIVVNDGSTDKTEEIVKRMMKTNEGLRLVSHAANRGYGATLRSGFEEAQGKLIFYTDSDNQYDIGELDTLIPLMKELDIAAGYRINRQDPWMRIVTASVYNQIIRWLLGLKIKDVDCSFKLYKKEVFDGIKLKSNTGLLDAEILIKAGKKGFKIGQIGVTHYPRTAGQTIYEIGKRNKFFAIIDPKVPIEILKEIGKLWKELR